MSSMNALMNRPSMASDRFHPRFGFVAPPTPLVTPSSTCSRIAVSTFVRTVGVPDRPQVQTRMGVLGGCGSRSGDEPASRRAGRIGIPWGTQSRAANAATGSMPANAAQAGAHGVVAEWNGAHSKQLGVGTAAAVLEVVAAAIWYDGAPSPAAMGAPPTSDRARPIRAAERTRAIRFAVNIGVLMSNEATMGESRTTL